MSRSRLLKTMRRLLRHIKELYPDDKVVVADAHQYLLDHYSEFDFIWSSPVCTTHTRINKNFGFVRYADMSLYQEIIFLEHWFKGKYCVENVIPYYKPLIPAQQHHRHLFWCNFKIRTTGKENPPKEINMNATKSKKAGKPVKNFIDNDDPKSLSRALGIDYNFKLYSGNNHSPGQVLRNAVHPEIGLMILNCARNIITKSDTRQGELFN